MKYIGYKSDWDPGLLYIFGRTVEKMLGIEGLI